MPDTPTDLNLVNDTRRALQAALSDKNYEGAERLANVLSTLSYMEYDAARNERENARFAREEAESAGTVRD